MKKIQRIIFLILISLFIVSFLSCGQEEEVKEEPYVSGLGIDINAYQEYGGWIYYIDYNNSANIYKVKSNGEKKTLIIDETVYSFVIYEDRIFYTKWNYYLYSANIDGSDDKKFYSLNEELLADDTVRAHKMQIEDGWIYILSDYRYYKIKTDGTVRTYLNNQLSIKNFSVEGDYIYYLEWGLKGHGVLLWEMKTDGTQQQQLMQESAREIDYDDNWIYYIDNEDDDIYKVSFDGNEKYKIAECNGKYIKVFGDWIYYFNNRDERGLYKIKTDGSENTYIKVFSDLEIKTDDSGKEYVTGDTVLYYGIFDQWLLCYGNEISAIKFGEPSETEELTYDIISEWPNTTIYE